ncbi:serine/threonine-protein kinase [Saccharothrix sp. ST-888]|uniref:serine/threonine-protein kinase n=1 Tax=Saccharothrix sp. ST-888 TaxID=1427391 RepID=UPI0009E536DB|nr:serine/threonine-protein kinase [Saccharothrix sp. ST-888]
MSADRPGAVVPPSFQALSADDPHMVAGYRLSARLGAGGMGRVYLSHTPGGRPVALKVVRPDLAEDPEFRQRFAQEVANARRIHGLYTAQVVDAGVDAAVPWLATAYVPGPSLQQVVQRYGPLPERTVLLLVAGIAEALQAIHGSGVVHRDLKPANVLIATDGPRVIDFGIARAADASALTATGLRIGSPAFMAPEQALGLTATSATDVFALGALAVHIAGGAPPFGDGPESVALYRAVHEEPDLTRVPAGLHELLRHCLAKQPEHRPTTAQVIEAARLHPAVSGDLRFTDDWLPHQVSSELVQRADLPQAPPPPPTALATLATLPDVPRPGTPASPSPVPPQEPNPHRRTRSGSVRRRSLRRTALTATVALLIGAAGAFALFDYLSPDDTSTTDSDSSSGQSASPSAPGSDSAEAAPGYTAVYTGAELTSPDHSYEFDIKTGKVAPEGSATWYVGRTADEFYVPDSSDAYIGQDDQLGTADCLRGVDSQPVTRLQFSVLQPGRSFCVRAQGSQDVAIVQVLSAASGDGPVKISMDYYRYDG